jgi:pimeloyl-ACP methyl ester carboxylesterase
VCVFVLVHGGWHGGWCWARLRPLLEAAGHRVLTPDLPGHGKDRTAPSERPWERYAASIVDLVAAEAAPVVLVGHSSGGMVISEVARRRPGDIAALVYLAAFLLPEGVSPRAVIGDAGESLLLPAIETDAAAGVMTIRPEMAREVFYHDCGDVIAGWAMARLQPEPLIPPGIVPDESEAPGEDLAVPRVYIETELDQALPLSIQRRMHAALPCQQVYSLRTGHSPFLSAPRELATILKSIAATYCI